MEIIRKSLIFPLLFMVIITFLGAYFRPWFLPNTFVSGLGATSQNQEKLNSTQLIKFNATIKNKGHYPVYVKDTRVIFLESVKTKFESGDKKLAVGKWLKPNETIDVNGEWLFNTAGIKDNNIMQSVPNFATFKVDIFP